MGPSGEVEHPDWMTTEEPSAMYADPYFLCSKQEMAWGSLLATVFVDAVIGALACLTVYFLEIPFAMFKSSVPLLIAPVTFLAAGVLRGDERGSWWARSGSINLGNWCLTATFMGSFDTSLTAHDWSGVLLWAIATFVATACGIAVRRFLA